MFLFFFFFQAEDGIRDRSPSRGLGDVYKRQVRRGLRRDQEKPPEDHWKKREPENEQKLLDEYYEFKGWNQEGIPKTDTLEEFGLDYVGEDLVERGILTRE